MHERCQSSPRAPGPVRRTAPRRSTGPRGLAGRVAGGIAAPAADSFSLRASTIREGSSTRGCPQKWTRRPALVRSGSGRAERGGPARRFSPRSGRSAPKNAHPCFPCGREVATHLRDCLPAAPPGGTPKAEGMGMGAHPESSRAPLFRPSAGVLGTETQQARVTATGDSPHRPAFTGCGALHGRGRQSGNNDRMEPSR